MPPMIGLAHRHITSSRPNGRHQPHAERSAARRLEGGGWPPEGEPTLKSDRQRSQPPKECIRTPVRCLAHQLQMGPLRKQPSETDSRFRAR
jgi:hypothetical protein